jgi:phage FluMu protein Com
MPNTAQDSRVAMALIHSGYFSEILRIEAESFEFPWLESDFRQCLTQRSVVGKVAVLGSRVAGYTVYEYLKSSFRLLNIAVGSEFRRRGVGSQMVAHLTSKLPENFSRAEEDAMKSARCPRCRTVSTTTSSGKERYYCRECRMEFEAINDGDIGYGRPERRLERQERRRPKR